MRKLRLRNTNGLQLLPVNTSHAFMCLSKKAFYCSNRVIGSCKSQGFPLKISSINRQVQLQQYLLLHYFCGFVIASFPAQLLRSWYSQRGGGWSDLCLIRSKTSSIYNTLRFQMTPLFYPRGFQVGQKYPYASMILVQSSKLLLLFSRRDSRHTHLRQRAQPQILSQKCFRYLLDCNKEIQITLLYV